MTSTDERARRYTRVGLTLLGVFLAGLFSRASQRANRQTGVVPGIDIDDDLVLGLGILGGLLILAALPILAVVRRRRGSHSTGASWWRQTRALFLATSVYGIGMGCFTGWGFEVDDELGMGVAAVLASVLVFGLGISERGKLMPFLALLAAAGASLVAAEIRIAVGGSRSRNLEIVMVLWIFFFPVAVGLFFLVRAFVGAHRGGGQGRLRTALAAPALELCAEDGVYRLRIEAPGLADAADVRVKITGAMVRLSIPRPRADARTILFSTRPRGRLEGEVLLPAPVEEEPAGIDLEHGLLSIMLVPLPEPGVEEQPSATATSSQTHSPPTPEQTA